MAKFFDAGAWLAGNPAQSCSTSVHVSQPAPLGCWTKAAAGGGSGSGSGDRFAYGDHSGACLMQLHCTAALHQHHIDPSMVLPAGLLPYVQPQTPASLDAGEYVAKGADEDFGVETLIRAAAAAGASLGMCSVVTYRNNLNKWVLRPHVRTVQQDGRDGTLTSQALVQLGGRQLVHQLVCLLRPHCRIFGLPFDTKAAWTVDACLLPAPASNAAAPTAGLAATSSSGAGSSASAGPLFLDIVQQEDWSGDPADRERFMKWGYRCGRA